MKTLSRTTWAAACALGFGLGFPVFLLFTEIIVGHRTRASGFVAHVIGLAVFGAVVATCQAVALRGLLPSLIRWVIAGAAGFALVNAVITPLYWSGVWPSPLPIEPIVITLCAGAFAAALQWLAVRRVAGSASRWLVLWVAGMAVGIFAGALVMMLVDSIKVSIPFGPDMGIFGLIVGAVAGAISGGAIFSMLSGRTDAGESVA
ncbi:MAG: hypothetical protein LC776_16855 [Acidobacteria bacterium]|nr:hypothetical protein [Acidobacteriota bacterium]